MKKTGPAEDQGKEPGPDNTPERSTSRVPKEKRYAEEKIPVKTGRVINQGFQYNEQWCEKIPEVFHCREQPIP